jgi:eukaryotic-like serine/threonine-protein kinase
MATLPKEEASRVLRPGAPAADAGAAPRPGSPAAPAVPARVSPGTTFAPGAVIDGRYRIVRFLNQGGAGVVHEVEHLRTGRRLAMKTLVDDASAARLEQEARATSLMRNAHVVKITDMGPPPGGRGAPYLVMELLEGQSLRDLLDEAGQLPPEMTVNIALQVCECLAEAHERSVIHRDLKPENLFLVKSAWPGQYDVVVLDFGVMKVAGEGPIPKGSLTRTGSTVGTPYYMSLEQLRNSSNVDARADVYSLGVVLYECLAGRKPFMADTIGDLVYALCSGPPTPLARLRPDLPVDVCDVVMRTLKMNRDDRPPSMAEVGASLLRHGHPAFGLWLRAGQGAGAASISPMASLREPTPNPSAAVSAPKVQPVLPSAPTPDEGEGTTVNAASPYRDEPTDAGGNLSEPVPTGPIPAMPHVPLPDDDGMPTGPVAAAPRGDRDTPTEMYRGNFGGDRDTPTRALPVPSLPDLESALAARGHVPAAGAPPPAPGGYDIDASAHATHRMLGPEARAAVAAPPRVAETLRSAPGVATPAPGALPPPPAEPPRFGPSVEPRATGTYPVATVKPAWQQALDRALTSVGGVVEGLVKKVKAQPPPVQYAVVGTIGIVVLLLLVLFLVLIFR